MVYSNKNVYDGNWHFGKRDGIGKMQFANGDMYEGQFKSDQLTGKGLYQCASGSSYEGELVDGSVSLTLSYLSKHILSTLNFIETWRREDDIL
jgi:hypothetical protein